MKNPKSRLLFNSLLTLTIFCLLANFSCSRPGVTPKPLSEQPAVPKPKNEKADIWLNNERLGDLENLDPLRTKLGAILKERAAKGVFIEGTNEIAGTVYIDADPQIAVKKFGAIANIIIEANKEARTGQDVPGLIYILKETAAADAPQTAEVNRFLLLLAVRSSAKPPTGFPLPLKDPEGRYSYRAVFRFESPNPNIANERKASDSLEIGADDKFYRNISDAPSGGAKNSGGNQKLIEKESLDNEVIKIIAAAKDGKKATILANSNATLESLKLLIGKFNQSFVVPEIVIFESQ
jgi:hypothetical protein